jgi:hypothetical protein
VPNDRSIGHNSGLNLKNRFLQSLDPLVTQDIFAKANSVSVELRSWAAPYTSIRAIRAYPLALSVAAAAPFADHSALVDTAKVSLWVFTLDDLLDEEGLSLEELRRRGASYRAIAHGEAVADASDPLAMALIDVRNSLASYRLFPALAAVWAAALCRTIDGMLLELDWREAYRRDGASALPSIDDYVKNGLDSIGGPPHIWSAIITTGDPTVVNQMSLFSEIERAASICVRLANDLQSSPKEAAEEKPNSLVILGQELVQQGFEPAEASRIARIRVQEAIRRELARLDGLQAEARTSSGQPEAAASDIARFVCEFYLEHDYHTFTSERPSGEFNAG